MRLFNKFKIYITKPSIFHNDPLTGGDTLFFKIKKQKNCYISKKF